MDFLMEKKQVKLKKYKLEKLGMSRLIAFSGISGPSGFHCTEKSLNFNGIFQFKWKALDWDFEGTNRANWLGETRVLKSN